MEDYDFTNFDNIFKNKFGNKTPILHILRDKLDNHIRLHWLPKSKQYPENERDLNLIENRLNNLIKFLLKEPLYCILPYFKGDCKIDFKKYYDQVSYSKNIDLGKNIYTNKYYDENSIVNFILISKIKDFEHLIKLLLKDKILSFIIINESNNDLIGIYQGGFDLFTRKNINDRFKDWLPK